MDFTDVSLVALRVFREVAERRTLTAAAAALGYTQSAVSRQIATLERAAGSPLLERRHDGVRLTPAGHVVLRRAATVLDEIDATARELAGLPTEVGTVRLGWFSSAGALLVPRALAALRRTHPAVTVHSREGSTPALVRALRAGTVDLAVVASLPPFRPPDTETPSLELEVLAERSLHVAVPATHPLAAADSVDVADLRGQRWIATHPLAAADSVDVADLRGQRWIATPSTAEESRLGVWPGLDERPEIAHTARDWLAKLHLVAAGCGLTTLPGSLAATVPPGVRVLTVRGGSQEQRRILLARLPRPLSEPAARLADALRAAAADAGPSH
ncbi:LysR family transcriptional regulator [Pseudonocardia xinjiangensis]|uniref:LysR family transcriptional regulator n=1 Tax=Pseudonocardia xinjiangensis TaxID=75289 RepID=UPI003D8F707C